MFNVGDHIVYPMHGAGIIDAIEEKNILGEKQAYYILKMPGELVLAENSSIDEVEGLIENKINASFKEFELDNIEPVQNVVNKFIPYEEDGTSVN